VKTGVSWEGLALQDKRVRGWGQKLASAPCLSLFRGGRRACREWVDNDLTGKGRSTGLRGGSRQSTLLFRILGKRASTCFQPHLPISGDLWHR